MLLEELVLRYCEHIFQGYVVVAKTIFRVTRNADINVDEAMYDHDMDYRSVMEEMVKNRRKLMPVRVEFQGEASEAIIDQLCKKLELTRDRVFFNLSPLDMGFGFTLCSKMERRGLPGLFYPPLTPQDSSLVTPGRPMIPQIEDHDILLSYPFESMKPFISLLLEAADDPTVLSIKMTLYRVARESPDRLGAHQGGGERQGGPRRRRAARAVRRGEQHHLVQAARGGGGQRRLRAGRIQGPLQAAGHHPPGGGKDLLHHPDRHRQL